MNYRFIMACPTAYVTQANNKAVNFFDDVAEDQTFGGAAISLNGQNPPTHYIASWQVTQAQGLALRNWYLNVAKGYGFLAKWGSDRKICLEEVLENSKYQLISGDV